MSSYYMYQKPLADLSLSSMVESLGSKTLKNWYNSLIDAYSYQGSIAYSFISTEEDKDSKDGKRADRWIHRLKAWLRQVSATYDPYFLDLESKAETLTDDASSTILTRTNDTPTTEGDFSGDNYTSSYVTTTSTSGRPNTQKAEEVLSLYDKGILQRLETEFCQNFLEGDNQGEETYGQSE